MELSDEELRAIPPEVAMRLLDYALKVRRMKIRELGVSASFVCKIRKGEKKVSLNMLRRIVSKLTLEEFLSVVAGEPPSMPGLPGSLALAARRVEAAKAELKAVMERFPELKPLVARAAYELLEAIGESRSYEITPEQVERFLKLLKAKSWRTARDHRCYLLRALNDLNWELSPDSIREYLAELKAESPNVARHVSKALKLFIKEVVKDPYLYNSFKVIRDESGGGPEPPSLEEVRAVAQAITWPPAKAYFALLAETGLRPGEVLSLKLSQLVLEERMVVVKKLSDSKRAYFSFFSPKLAKYLKDVYLPYREEFIRKYGPAVRNLLKGKAEEWEALLFPFKPSSIRSAIYEAMDKALGRRFRLYDLRSFFSTFMIEDRNVNPLAVEIWQGRLPPKLLKILFRRYLGWSIRKLKALYDMTELSVL